MFLSSLDSNNTYNGRKASNKYSLTNIVKFGFIFPELITVNLSTIRL